MNTFRQKIENTSAVLARENSKIRLYTERAGVLKFLWEDFIELIKQLSNTYANCGRRHLEGSDDLEKAIRPIPKKLRLVKILVFFYAYLGQIGEFFVNQAHDFSYRLKEKYLKFNKEIEEFCEQVERKAGNIIKETGQLISDMKKEEENLEKTVRKHEDIKRNAKSWELSKIKADKTLEAQFRNEEIKVGSTISAREENLLKKFERFSGNIKLIKDVFAHYSIELEKLERNCMGNIKSLVFETLGLFISISEFKKNTSEILKTSVFSIKYQDSPKTLSNIINLNEDSLKSSEQKIEILISLKSSLTNLANLEETLDQDYIKHKETYLIKRGKLSYSSVIFTLLKDLEKTFKFHKNIGEEIRNTMIKPIETLIRVQTSLNSSMKISLKQLSKSPIKLDESLLNSPGPDNKNRSNSLDNSPNPSKNLKNTKEKELLELLVNHIFRENAYLSSILPILALIHEKNSYFLEFLMNLSSSIQSSLGLNNSLTLFPQSLSANLDPNSETPSLLNKTSRNNFIVKAYDSDSEDEEFNRRFNIKIKEPVISSYLCAFEDGILLQGKLYLTANYVCFYSHFNSSTIIGKETSMMISLSDVLKVEKKSNFLIFDNSLEIKTRSSVLFFTSFISRDEAFSILEKLVSLHNCQSVKKDHPVDFIVEARPHRLALKEKIQRIKGNSIKGFPDSYFTTEIFESAVDLGIPIQQVYELFYSNSNKSFYITYLSVAGDINIEITDWSELPPNCFFNKSEEFCSATATRSITCDHKIKERLPFIPAYCKLIEQQTIYFLDAHVFVVESQIQVDIPYGDYFSTYLKWTITGGEHAEVRASCGIVFTKSTIFKGKIIRGGIKESIDTMREIWKPLAIKIVKESLGLKVKSEEIGEKKIETQTEIKWELYCIIAILLLVIIKLLKSVSDLQKELEIC